MASVLSVGIEMLTSEKTPEISQEESKRISVLKVWLSVMVVFIHSYGSNLNFVGETVYIDTPLWLEILKYAVSEVLSRVAVPSFFFLSAYFLYRKRCLWRENILKKIRTLAVPYLILNTFWIVVFFVAQQIPQLSHFFANPENRVANWGLRDWLIHYIGSRDNFAPLLYPLWFVRNLFLLNLLAPVFSWFVKKAKAFSAVFFVALWLVLESTHVFFMDVQSICFWGLGCFFAISGISLSSLDRHKTALAVSYPILVVATCLMHVNPGFLELITKRACYLIGAAFWLVFTTKIKNERMQSILLFISGYSFSIYLFHEMGLSIIRKVLTRIFPHTVFFAVFLYFVMPIIIISLCLVISRLMEKFVPKIYRIITGGRSK